MKKEKIDCYHCRKPIIGKQMKMYVPVYLHGRRHEVLIHHSCYRAYENREMFMEGSIDLTPAIYWAEKILILIGVIVVVSLLIWWWFF